MTRRTAPVSRIALCAALSALAAALPAPALQDEPDELLFGERVRVEVVNVDVVVTDRDGEPVLDLERADFELFEDGRPVEITHFHRHAAAAPGSVEPADRVEGEGGGAPPAERASTAAPGDEERQLHIVIWIDEAHIHPLHRNRVLGRLREFLRRQAPTARVMLVTADRSAHVRQPFTDDPELVARALLELEKGSGGALAAESERAEMLRRMEAAESAAEIVPRLRLYVRSVHDDVRASLRALKSFVEPLAGLPGRKAIVHVSDGLPAQPGHDLFWAVQEKFPGASVLHEAQPYDATRALEEVAATASANRVAFHTLDAAGLRVHAASAADRRSALDRLTPTMDALWVSNLQAPLRLLAERTGGVAILNTNDPGPGLERIARELAAGYSLGFANLHGGDGRYHRLEVKVRREGLAVRHREGYRDRSPADRMGDTTTAGLLFGRTANRMGISLEDGAQRPRQDGHRAVALEVEIPFAAMALVPRAGSHHGRLRLFVRVMDRAGALSALQQVPVPVELPSRYLEAAQEERFTYELELLMRPGPHQVAVAVWDELAGEGATVVEPVLVD